MKPDLAAGTGTGSAARRQPNWELLIFAIPFTCFALYMSYGFYSSYQEQQDASSSFRPVPARILSAQVETSMHRQSGAVGSTQVYQPRILYEYGVDGRTYSSHRFGYFGAAYGSRDEAQLVVARYPAGSAQTAYVNPNDPAEAVLNKSSPSAWWKHFWFPTLFVFVGFLGLFGGWRGWLRKSG